VSCADSETLQPSQNDIAVISERHCSYLSKTLQQSEEGLLSDHSVCIT